MHHHIGTFEYFLRGGYNFSAVLDIHGVLKSAANAGRFLHQDCMPAVFHHFNSGGSHRDAIFFSLDFFENANDHSRPPLSVLGWA